MFGGLLKSTSLAALVAVAGVAISGSSAQAADLGGNCCADLEERIAELEATTARKGNRKVSLTISGQVNQNILFFDDGVTKNAFVADNEASRSRVRFLGSAKIDASWSAGYLLELGTRGNRQDNLSQLVDNGAASKTVDVRHSVWWLANKDLGKVWLGLTSDAADGITEISLANTGHFATAEIQDYFNGFLFRRSDTGNLTDRSYGTIWGGGRAGANPGEGDRFNVAKYDTPTIAGFIGSASWGENDQWALGLRYAGEFAGFKLAAGVAYMDTTDGGDISSSNGGFQNGARGCVKTNLTASGGSDVSCQEVGASASLMHVPTGLFVTGAYGRKTDDNRILLSTPIRKNDEFYYVQAGIEQKFFPVGKSTFFGEYFQGSYGAVDVTPGQNATTTQANAAFSANRSLGGLAGSGITGVISKTDITMWGVGFNQNIEAAAMDIYVDYRNLSADIFGSTSGGARAAVNDLQIVTTGAVIKF